MSGDGNRKRKVGILGYGHLGKHLAKVVLSSDDMELCFVWNRTASAVTSDGSLPNDILLDDIRQARSRNPDLVVEVSHPKVSAEHGPFFLEFCDFMVGSPTALAEDSVEKALREATRKFGKSLFLPAGALWGGADIERMAACGSLTALEVTMKKHPRSLKVDASLMPAVESALPRSERASKKAKISSDNNNNNNNNNNDDDDDDDGDDDKIPAAVEVFRGPVRELCPLAPNNVNTMACAAVASGEAIGFDKTIGVLVADASLDAHIVTVTAVGQGGFKVETVRTNPAGAGAVTGNATFLSFEASMRTAARGRPCGVHLV